MAVGAVCGGRGGCHFVHLHVSAQVSGRPDRVDLSLGHNNLLRVVRDSVPQQRGHHQHLLDRLGLPQHPHRLRRNHHIVRDIRLCVAITGWVLPVAAAVLLWQDQDCSGCMQGSWTIRGPHLRDRAGAHPAVGPQFRDVGDLHSGPALPGLQRHLHGLIGQHLHQSVQLHGLSAGAVLRLPVRDPLVQRLHPGSGHLRGGQRLLHLVLQPRSGTGDQLPHLPQLQNGAKVPSGQSGLWLAGSRHCAVH